MRDTYTTLELPTHTTRVRTYSAGELAAERIGSRTNLYPMPIFGIGLVAYAERFDRMRSGEQAEQWAMHRQLQPRR